MTAFLLRRLLWLVLTLWIVFTVSFFLMRSVPGGPFSQERELEPQIAELIQERYRLDDPLWKQYLRELTAALRGDLGHSYRKPDFSNAEIIAQGLPVSASLGIVALAFAVVLGLPAGILSAVRRGTLVDAGLMLAATIGIALPNFIIASVLIILLVFLVPVFPAGGWGSLNQLILPAFCLGAPYAAFIARLTRTGMLDVLSQDYIRTAYAKGLSDRVVILRHALRLAMVPVVSFLGPAIAGILTGSLVIEQIFAIPGLGAHFVEAALMSDYTLAMAVVLLYTVLLYTMNFVVDLSYSLIDPRVKLE
jgi:oligopeptide transport system permease protein